MDDNVDCLRDVCFVWSEVGSKEEVVCQLRIYNEPSHSIRPILKELKKGSCEYDVAKP
jgi:hypothetical protein